MDIGGPQVSVFPATDPHFTRSVEQALTSASGRRVEDAGILAAAQALLRTIYPLATLQRREETSSRDASAWDAFRDGSVLDEELVRRARGGSTRAADQLFDRHQRLVYAVAIICAGRSAGALDAVEIAFRTVILEQTADQPVRIRLAIASRDAAARVAAPGSSGSVTRDRLPRTVLQLAHGHHLSGTEIAAVLKLDVGHVRVLAIEGLKAVLQAGSPGTAGDHAVHQ